MSISPSFDRQPWPYCAHLCIFCDGSLMGAWGTLSGETERTAPGAIPLYVMRRIIRPPLHVCVPGDICHPAARLPYNAPNGYLRTIEPLAYPRRYSRIPFLLCLVIPKIF